MPFLIPLLTTVLPLLLTPLIKTAEQTFKNKEPGMGTLKREWVLEFFEDLFDILEAKGLVPAKYHAIAETFLPKIAEKLEAQVAKLKQKGAI